MGVHVWRHTLATLAPGNRPGTHYTGGWVGSRASLQVQKILSLLVFDPWTIRPVASHCVLSQPTVKCVSYLLSLVYFTECLLSKNSKIKIFTTLILPHVLYGREIWTLASRKECKLRVFENSLLMRIFGPKRDEELVNGMFYPYTDQNLYRYYWTNLNSIMWI